MINGKSRRNPREDYITSKNLNKKATHWMAELKPYLSKTRNRRFIWDTARSALLVIDMQEFFLDQKSHAYLPAARAIIENVGSLIKVFRTMQRPVIYTRHAFLAGEDADIMGRWWGDTIRDGTHESNIHHKLKPIENETIIRKTKYSALAGTGLEELLKKSGISQLVITGVLTHLCCETTARAAFMRGFEVYFVIDATATQDETLHLGSLRALTDGFVIPLTTASILKKIKSGNPAKGGRH